MIVNGKAKYDGVLKIPKGTSGDFAIVHKVLPRGTKLFTSNFRTAFHARHKGQELVYATQTRWHKLTEHGGVWMTDLPIEQYQHDQALKKFHGRVLVGGLGLGYAITALSAKTSVKEIVVVEKSQDVANLVYEHTKSRKTQLVVADLHEYLQDDIGQFTFGFYDIWQSDGECTFHETVLPLRDASKGKVRTLECWNEDVMRGQLFQSLQSRLMWFTVEQVTPSPAVPTVDELADGCREGQPSDSVWVRWAQPYWRWYRRTQPSVTTAQHMALRYAQLYGVGNDYLSSMLSEAVTTAAFA